MNYGRYQILKELGRGSMGVVYLARDPNIDRLVAVKVLRQDRSADDIFVKRFLKEAKVIGRLSHPHTVTVHDIGEEQGEIYIAMEYIDGPPLSDIIKEKHLDAKEVVAFGVQIAETLDYAHQKGVIHRDIKPSNIIVQPDGQVKITDFGIARIEDSNASLQTQAGETMGTPSYMSPEQVLGQTVDRRSDLFSLGVVLYELSTGKRPFGGEGKTLATVFNEIIQVNPLDPDLVSEQLPHGLSALIMKALQKDPAKRFQSGRELADALNVCLGAGQRAEVPTTTPVPSAQSRRTVYVVYVIPLASAAVLSIVAGWLFFSSHYKETSPVKNTYPASESREASPPGPQRTGVMNVDKKQAPSVPQPAPTIKKAEIPDRGMPKEMSKQAPSSVPTEPDTKQAFKPDTKQVKETPLPPVAAQEKPAAKKAESATERLPGDRNAEKPTLVATLLRWFGMTSGNGKPPQQSGGEQIPLPVESEPLPKFAFLKVRTTPKGAAVYVDGVHQGTSPLTLKLNLGKYRVKLGLAGYLDTECVVSLDRMTEYPLTEKLRPIEQNKTGNRP